jgi:hypothetical protein
MIEYRNLTMPVVAKRKLATFPSSTDPKVPTIKRKTIANVSIQNGTCNHRALQIQKLRAYKYNYLRGSCLHV